MLTNEKTDQTCNPASMAYVGTYTRGNSKGIYRYLYNAETGTLVQNGPPTELTNASYLAIDRENKHLYAVMETADYDGENSGAVAAYSIDGKTGELTCINRQPTRGKSPCHLTMDRRNRFIFVSNYSGGTLTVFPVNPDGSLAPCSSIQTHQGLGADKSRQKEPHIHFSQLTPDEQYLCVVDLGIDKVVVYDFDPRDGSLKYNEKLTINLKPGSGPRHLVFSKNGRYVYVVTELSSEIAVFEYCPAEATFKEIQYVSALPDGYRQTSYCAAIRISPNGKFLYASNRGHDSIAAFRIDENSGKITLVSHTPTGGSWPRDFTIDPAGNFLFVANERSHTLTKFAIDKTSGKLTKGSDILNIENPACILFMVLSDDCRDF